MSPDIVGIQARLCCAMSSPVTTATTPGSAAAAVVSMPLIVACAYGLRRSARWSIFGSFTSSMYVPLPWMNRSSSLRLTLCPMPRISSASVAMSPPRVPSNAQLPTGVSASAAIDRPAVWIAFTMFM